MYGQAASLKIKQAAAVEVERVTKCKSTLSLRYLPAERPSVGLSNCWGRFFLFTLSFNFSFCLFAQRL